MNMKIRTADEMERFIADMNAPTLCWSADKAAFKDKATFLHFCDAGRFDPYDFIVEYVEGHQSPDTTLMDVSSYYCITWVNDDRSCVFSSRFHPLYVRPNDGVDEAYAGYLGCTGEPSIATTLRTFILANCLYEDVAMRERVYL